MKITLKKNIVKKRKEITLKINPVLNNYITQMMYTIYNHELDFDNQEGLKSSTFNLWKIGLMIK